jgi:hypothetical protein
MTQFSVIFVGFCKRLFSVSDAPKDRINPIFCVVSHATDASDTENHSSCKHPINKSIFIALTALRKAGRGFRRGRGLEEPREASRLLRQHLLLRQGPILQNSTSAEMFLGQIFVFLPITDKYLIQKLPLNF